MSQIEISPRVTIAPRPIPTVDELRAAPPSKFEERVREAGPGSFKPIHDQAAIRARGIEMGGRCNLATCRVLADEFGCSIATARRAMRGESS